MNFFGLAPLALLASKQMRFKDVFSGITGYIINVILPAKLCPRG